MLFKLYFQNKLYTCLISKIQQKFSKSPFQSKNQWKTPFGAPVNKKNQTIVPKSNPFQQKIKQQFKQNKQPFLNQQNIDLNKPLKNNQQISTPLNIQNVTINQKQVKQQFNPPPLNFDIFSKIQFDQKIVKKIQQVVPLSQQNKNQNLESKQQKKQTLGDFVVSNVGLNQYLTRIFITTGSSLALTLTAAYVGLFIPNIKQISDALMIGSGLLSFGLLKRASQMAPTFIQLNYKGDKIYKTKNGIDRISIFSLGCIALGFSASPIFLQLGEASAFLPTTLAITMSIFGGASLVSMMIPRSFRMNYGSVFAGGLFGLFGLKGVNLITAKYLGASLLASSLFGSFENLMGIGLFTGLLIYDTYHAIKRYENKDADHLGMSIQILLDVWNLILRVAKEIIKAKARQGRQKNNYNQTNQTSNNETNQNQNKKDK